MVLAAVRVFGVVLAAVRAFVVVLAAVRVFKVKDGLLSFLPEVKLRECDLDRRELSLDLETLLMVYGDLDLYERSLDGLW